MKKKTLIIGMLLGIAASALFVWMKPQTDDPYFFLTPKVVDVFNPIDIPIELYRQGATVDQLFWITPMPEEKYFYLIPSAGLGSTSRKVQLIVKENGKEQVNFYHSELFTSKGLVKLADKTPMLTIELYKINPDLSESLIKQNTRLYNSVSPSLSFLLLTLSEENSQYRLKVTVLGDWPQLKDSGLDYFIRLTPVFYK